MTVIQPNKYREFIKLAVIMGLLSVFLIVYGVFTYLQTVSLRHDLEISQSNLDKLRVENAELKNKYFALVDSGSLTALAVQKGLVKDQNPQWVSASQF